MDDPTARDDDALLETLVRAFETEDRNATGSATDALLTRGIPAVRAAVERALERRPDRKRALLQALTHVEELALDGAEDMEAILAGHTELGALAAMLDGVGKPRGMPSFREFLAEQEAAKKYDARVAFAAYDEVSLAKHACGFNTSDYGNAFLALAHRGEPGRIAVKDCIAKLSFEPAKWNVIRDALEKFADDFARLKVADLDAFAVALREGVRARDRWAAT